jgi:xanthine dehydrogenase accessory factor
MIQTTCNAWFFSGRDFIFVTISGVVGSAPREAGATLAVSAEGIVGTIGGGRLEWDAIAEARAMLASGKSTKQSTIALGPVIGQCCGGRVTLSFQRGNAKLISQLVEAETAEITARPLVHIYGAGHVGRALANALAPLPLRVLLIDSRADELARCLAVRVEKYHTETLVSRAEEAPPNSAHVIMTHSHTLDSLIAGAVLERGDFRYLGIIGSKTKRASFLKAFRTIGITKPMLDRVICPIGGNAVADKRPEIIAALTAAEIVQALL